MCTIVLYSVKHAYNVRVHTNKFQICMCARAWHLYVDYMLEMKECEYIVVTSVSFNMCVSVYGGCTTHTVRCGVPLYTLHVCAPCRRYVFVF